MVSVAEAFVTMRPDFDGFGRDAQAGVKRGMSGIAKVAVGAIAAVGVGRMLGSAISEAGESRRIARITEQSIKTTGRAANISAGQIGSMSEELGVMSGVDDEVIQQGANLLLTFKRVRNEAGKGADIFNRATKAGLDMAAQGFGTPETNAKQLGKALQDPLKGLTALGRAGVTFTEDQKEQIKTLVETGDLLGAQKIILDEVEGQVGGAAKASADPLARLSVVTGNLKEQLGTALLPVVDRVASFLGTNLPAAAEAVKGAFDEGGLAGVFSLVVDKIGDALPGIWAKLQEWGAAFIDWIGPRIPPLLSKLGELAGTVATWLGETGLPWLGEKLAEWGQAFVDWIGPKVPGILRAIGDASAAVFDWLIFTGLPWLVEKLELWSEALINWVTDSEDGMLQALEDLMGNMTVWVENDGTKHVESAWGALGRRIVQSMKNAVIDEWNQFIKVELPILFNKIKSGTPLDRFIDDMPVQELFDPGNRGGGTIGDGGGGGGSRDFADPVGDGGGVVAKGLNIGTINITTPKPAPQEVVPALRRAAWSMM